MKIKTKNLIEWKQSWEGRVEYLIKNPHWTTGKNFTVVVGDRCHCNNMPRKAKVKKLEIEKIFFLFYVLEYINIACPYFIYNIFQLSALNVLYNCRFRIKIYWYTQYK